MNRYNTYKQHPIYKGKLWDIEDHEIGVNFKRINENRWFEQQQNLLLWMANTDYGRNLLCIDKFFPKITEISKSHIAGVVDWKPILGTNKFLITKIGDFRIGAKWANVVRYRWKEFQEYAQEYYRLQRTVNYRVPILFPVAPVYGFSYLTSTTFPDPDPETTSVDGVLQATATNSWATQRARASCDTVVDNTNAERNVRVITNASGSNISFDRSCFLFDTSGLGSTAVVSAATISWWFTESFNNYTTDPQWVVVGCAPASNTGLVVGDFDVATKWTMTAYTTAANMGGITTGAYTDYTINASGQAVISLTSITKYGTVHKGDQTNTDPSENSKTGRMTPTWAEAAGTANDPKLVITYTLAAGGAPNMAMLGVGG